MKTPFLQALLLTIALCAPGADAQTLEWMRELEEHGQMLIRPIEGRVISLDGLGHVYLVNPVSLSKYDTEGSLDWSVRTSDEYTLKDVSADALGNVFVAVSDSSSLDENRNAVVANYDASGERRWAVQLEGDGEAYGSSVAADDLGNVYLVAGSKQRLEDGTLGHREGILQKYDTDGNELWTSVGSEGFSVDFNDAFAYTFESELQRYDSEGALQWTVLPDTRIFSKLAVSSSGAIYVCTVLPSDEDPRPFTKDAVIHRFDEHGGLQWTRRIGTEQNTKPWGIATDSLGNAYLTGVTNGISNSTGEDLFVAKFAPDGDLQWLYKHDSPLRSDGQGIAVDDDGNIYVAGTTANPDDYGLDVSFLAKFTDNPHLLPGDFNSDGVVDAADFTTWRDGLGDQYMVAHYEIWKSNFGRVADTPSSPTAPVPEPSSAVLALLASAAFLGRTVRWRARRW